MERARRCFSGVGAVPKQSILHVPAAAGGTVFCRTMEEAGWESCRLDVCAENGNFRSQSAGWKGVQ